MDEDELAEEIESRLMNKGAYVDEFEHRADDETYAVTYKSVSVDQGTLSHREIGQVINVFRDLHDDDWTGANIEATITDLDETVRAYWYVDAEWFDELHNGDLSQTEFSQRVLDTVST